MSRQFLALHVTSWLSRRGGGIPPVIRALAAESVRLGVDSSIAGLRESEPDEANAGDWPMVFSGRSAGPESFGFSPELRREVQAAISRARLLHVHGLWMYPGVMARGLARQHGIPLIISPHGMLEPWALRNSAWKKRLAAWVFERRNLGQAACLHALCEAEASHFRCYGLKNPIAVIPNGIDVAEFDSLPNYRALEGRYPELRQRRRALFLSRIHPKKGLVHLLRAWSQVGHGRRDWVLLIAGPDEAGHEAELKALAAELGLRKSVFFLGPLYGDDKKMALAGADLLVLPSFSEGFSMAILEAAACGLPVLLTPQCNFHELTTAGGGVEVAPDAPGCEAGLRQLFGMSESDRKQMGRRGRCLVERAYTWESVAKQMLAVYRWVLGEGRRPACV